MRKDTLDRLVSLGIKHAYEKILYPDPNHADHGHDVPKIEPVWVGIHEWHYRRYNPEKDWSDPDPSGMIWCVGYCLFAVPAADEWVKMFGGGNKTRWKVESWEPLTLSPSIACKVCPSHGFIRNGKWEGN